MTMFFQIVKFSKLICLGFMSFFSFNLKNNFIKKKNNFKMILILKVTFYDESKINK